MPAEQETEWVRHHKVPLYESRDLHLVSYVKPVDGFADLISLQVMADHDHLHLEFASRQQLLLFHAALQALLSDTAPQQDSAHATLNSAPIFTDVTRAFSLR